ncbi:MAG: alanine racemase [Patescibacteria group bacterium]|nr:alanine racemase [Patescibacteria group bacterium]
MIIKDDKKIIERVKNFLEKEQDYKIGDLLPIVEDVLKKKDRIEELSSKNKTPFYIFDSKSLDKSIDLFVDSFKKIKSFKPYYAMKLNHYTGIVEYVVKKGMGVDAGSIREIDIAIKAGSEDILYFSPGKTDDDIEYVLKFGKKITINIDSFNELKKIDVISRKFRKKMCAGVRVHIDLHGDWKKYGIHINDLKKFWNEANNCKFINLQGIHFHMSRNSTADFYKSTIKEVGDYLKSNFSKTELEEIKFIDFGGGFEVIESEGFYPSKTPQGSIIEAVNSNDHIEAQYKHPYYIRDAIKIEEYAKIIDGAIHEYLDPIVDVTYYSEPGRFICNNTMHIVLSVVDIKDDKNIILSGGVNMVGWQRFEYEYFPLINISSPAKEEIKCNMWGNLCTTWDIWGYYCYAKEFKENDIIVVPNQGALTYSLAQNFIQPIPDVYLL